MTRKRRLQRKIVGQVPKTAGFKTDSAKPKTPKPKLAHPTLEESFGEDGLAAGTHQEEATKGHVHHMGL